MYVPHWQGMTDFLYQSSCLSLPTHQLKTNVWDIQLQQNSSEYHDADNFFEEWGQVSVAPIQNTVLHPMCQHFFLFLPFFWSFSWFYWYRNRWQFPSLLSSSERKDVKKSIEIMKNEHSEYKITYSRIDFTWNRLTLTINDRNTIFL